MSRTTGVAIPDVADGARRTRREARPALRGDIEGLRAVAVGTVLLFHMGVPWVSGGFAGVDIFFVISGFLITSLLLREATRTGSVSILDFYARRARRLLPAASVVLVATAALGYLVMPSSSRGDLGTDVLTATAYVINWGLALRAVDYLDEGADVSPLQHYWSLSVEEQFYVFWPLLILLGLVVARRTGLRPMRLLFGVLAAVAALSFGYSVLHTASDPATAYFFTTTRAWELAIGALTAFAVDRLRRTLTHAAATVLASVGLAMIAVAVLVLDKATPWPGSAALVPTIGTALVIAAGCASQTTGPARLLGLRPMTWLGGLSYSVYLWHWPLVVLAEIRWPDISTWQTVVVGLLSIPLALVTKRLVEDPIRFDRALSARPRRALALGAALMAVSALAGVAVLRSVPDLGTTRPVEGATALVADQAASPWQVRDDPETVFTTSGRLTPNPAVAPQDVPAYYDDDCQVPAGDTEVDTTCTYGDPTSDRVMALVGDSKTGQWFPALEAIAQREGMRLDLYLKSTCAFGEGSSVPDECAEFTRHALTAMEAPERRPDVVVSSAGADFVRAADLAAPLQTLEDRGADVVVLANNTHPGSEVYRCVAEAEGGDYARCGFPREEVDASLGQAAEQVGGTYVPVDEWICPPGASTCPPAVAGTLVYRQGSHVTATYARTTTPIIWRQLSAAGVTRTPVEEITVEDIPEATGSARG
ncbi:hypothetical protein AWH69_00785 [Janibacter melonis]|uniref:Acyltransferase n=1 Tax=Janibacter melonis TaxID=262209 RepID=A0A176QF90_9MICO|nr:acyltransferase family protein [Janibacter melonis]OAB88383.1 hypothetical protein AWH69_00785 [Janibacter melonis]